MKDHARIGRAWIAMAFGMTTIALAQDERPLVGPATTDEIARLVRALGDPSYEARTFATRRLCAIGPEASETLRTAAGGTDAEAAMRAKQLLVVFDQLLFAGSEVSLSFSKSEVPWMEPVDLIVTIVNKSNSPSRIPLDVDAVLRAAGTADARQVMDMLDVADWLKVRSPEGRGVELRMDEPAQDASVMEALQSRVGETTGGVVPPGEKVTITLQEFNRGWARYPMFNRGEYSVMLDYLPDWTDDVLSKANAGRVMSNAATIKVTEGAPPTVSRGGAPAEILVEQEGDAFVARFVNRTDKSMLVNTNFGSAAPFAEGRWVFEADGNRREVGLTAKLRSTWKEFERSLLLEVDAGQSIELGRIAARDAQKAIAEGAAERRSTGWTVGLSYANLCDRTWQAQQGRSLRDHEDAPPILREPLPRQLLGTRLMSNRVAMPGGN